MKIEVGFEEGDYLVINSKRWEVVNIDDGVVTLSPIIGTSMDFDRARIEEMIRYAEKFRLYREDSLTAKDF